MSGETEFDYKMTRLICAGVAVPFCVVVLTIGSCTFATTANNNAAIAGIVKNGASPVAAYCAVRGYSSDTSCAITAARQP